MEDLNISEPASGLTVCCQWKGDEVPEGAQAVRGWSGPKLGAKTRRVDIYINREPGASSVENDAAWIQGPTLRKGAL